MPEMSLEDKLQAKFAKLFEEKKLDKNCKYYFSYWDFEDIEKNIIRIIPETESPTKFTEFEQQFIDRVRGKFLILEYSNKRSKWELSVPGKG